MKLRELRMQKGLKQNEFAKLVGVSNMCMCLIENYKCLPVPQDMEEMCKVLDCEVDKIYEPYEIALKKIKTRQFAVDKNSNRQMYHLTANLPNRARKFFKNNLSKLGFKNITEWVNYCFERLENQFEEQKKKDFTQACKPKSRVQKIKENIDIISINNISKNNLNVKEK